MARYLYTVETDPGENPHAAVSALNVALRREFPAFSVYDYTAADRVIAIVIKNVTDETPPVEAWNRLNGWGNGNLTLELV
jgi:hypothetical protein